MGHFFLIFQPIHPKPTGMSQDPNWCSGCLWAALLSQSSTLTRSLHHMLLPAPSDPFLHISLAQTAWASFPQKISFSLGQCLIRLVPTIILGTLHSQLILLCLGIFYFLAFQISIFCLTWVDVCRFVGQGLKINYDHCQGSNLRTFKTEISLNQMEFIECLFSSEAPVGGSQRGIQYTEVRCDSLSWALHVIYLAKHLICSLKTPNIWSSLDS